MAQYASYKFIYFFDGSIEDKKKCLYHIKNNSTVDQMENIHWAPQI